MNIVILSGRLATQPELRETANGRSVCTFRIAVNRPGRATETQDADFFSCVAWNGIATSIAEWFYPGKPIEIVGYLENDNYEKDGVKHYGNQIVVKEFHFVESEKPKESLISQMPDEEEMDEFEEILNEPFRQDLSKAAKLLGVSPETLNALPKDVRENLSGTVYYYTNEDGELYQPELLPEYLEQLRTIAGLDIPKENPIAQELTEDEITGFEEFLNDPRIPF